MALGILFGYLIGKNKYETSPASSNCTNNNNKTPLSGMARSDEEKEEYYKNVFAEMKADNIRNNLRFVKKAVYQRQFKHWCIEFESLLRRDIIQNSG